MKAIIIKRPLTDTESADILGKIETGVYALFSDVSLPGRLQSFTQGNYDISEEEKKRINYETMDFVISFGDKMMGGKAVVDWLGFEGSSIWYYHKFRAYFRMRNLKYEQAEVNRLAEEYEEVKYYTSNHFLQKLQLPDKVSLLLSDTEARTKRNYYSIIRYLMILKSRFLLNIFSYHKLRKPDHIIMDVTKRQAFLDINTLKERKGNYVIGYLLDKAGKDFLIIDEAVQPKLSDDAKISLNRDNLFGKGSRKNRFFGEPLLLKYFLSGRLREKKKKLLRDIHDSLNKLEELCKEEDEKLLIVIYRSFRDATNFYLIKYLAYQKFFRKHSFKTITTVAETSPAFKSILDAARSCGIKTIGVQHGNLHDLHPSYIYTYADCDRQVVPDHSLIWGSFWKDFLINKGHYPVHSSYVCGQIRTDIIPHLTDSKVGKEQVFPGISEKNKLIVFASQPQRDPRLRERAALDVINAVKAIPEAFLVIKLHPNEINNKKYYAGLAKKAGLDRIEITHRVDLYLLISVCDLLITCFSTVGTETVYFGKPLIILDHLKQDIQNYHKEGVAFQASNEQELRELIKDILSGKSSIDKKAYDDFISKYAYAIDGKAVDRTLEFIGSL
ncbi:MAG: CDP-glycerol glycerophosphotransferase family protein [Bacteroidales bacterium]|nr:CDP-glycerol glycerophosphotransferase family protein [Bacteroidales bacterium]